MSGLLGAMGISHSALRVETQRVATTANNIANMNTHGFRAGRVVSVEQPTGGVSAMVEDSGAPTPIGFQGGEIVELSNTDLATEVVTQKMAVASYKANLAVIRTADQMLEAALDVWA